LEEHEKGLVRDHSYAQDDKLTIEEITNVLKELVELDKQSESDKVASALGEIKAPNFLV